MPLSIEPGALPKAAPEASLTLAAPALTGSQIDTALFPNSRMWAGSTITYSFPTSASLWPAYEAGEEPSVGFTALTSAQQAQFRAAILTWDRLIAPTLVQTDDLTATGQIRVAFSGHADLDDLGGYAYGPPTPGEGSAPWQGDIWLNGEDTGFAFTTGASTFLLLIHEIGHALGLKHSFEGQGALPTALENTRFTVMSYTDPQDVVAVNLTETSDRIEGQYRPVLPSTPMVLDVAAIQQRYGADPTTATGADTYAYSAAQPFFATLYDAGGVDTIDLSAFSRGSDVDLAPGAYSSIGFASAQTQIAEWIDRFPWADSFIRDLFAEAASWISGKGVYTGLNNLGIAASTVIENVIGGSGADTLTGADAANGMLGGGGADFMRGLNGDDWMDGGAGADDVNGNQGADQVHGGDGADLVRGGQGPDTVYGEAGDDPHLNGNLGDDIVYGGAGRDTLFGGQGADVLYGEDGDDWLSGDLGDDTLSGGPGADRYIVRAGGGMDWVTGFQSAAGDRVQLSPGAAYTVRDVGGQAVVDLGAGDGIGLAGVPVASLGDWLVVV